MRVACLLVGVLFLVSAGLQWNDPDPTRWIAIWGAGAAVSLAAAWRPLPRALAWGVAAVALVWALMLAPATAREFRLDDLAREMHAGTPAIERNRELLGLLLIAVWSAVVALTRGAGNKTAREPPGRS